MDQTTVLSEFHEAQAILRGHFILSSGLHSDTYLQCARVLMRAERAERLCRALADKLLNIIDKNNIDIVVSPAMGGVVVGYEMGRQLELESVFCERVNGEFTLRRGFLLPNDAKVLVVEDVVTTGKSSLEAFECVRAYGGTVVAEACLIDRSNGTVDLGVPLVSLAEVEVQTFEADAVPEALKDVPAVKPGSRKERVEEKE